MKRIENSIENREGVDGVSQEEKSQDALSPLRLKGHVSRLVGAALLGMTLVPGEGAAQEKRSEVDQWDTHLTLSTEVAGYRPSFQEQGTGREISNLIEIIRATVRNLYEKPNPDDLAPHSYWGTSFFEENARSIDGGDLLWRAAREPISDFLTQQFPTLKKLEKGFNNLVVVDASGGFRVADTESSYSGNGIHKTDEDFFFSSGSGGGSANSAQELDPLVRFSPSLSGVIRDFEPRPEYVGLGARFSNGVRVVANKEGVNVRWEGSF